MLILLVFSLLLCIPFEPIFGVPNRRKEPPAPAPNRIVSDRGTGTGEVTERAPNEDPPVDGTKMDLHTTQFKVTSGTYHLNWLGDPQVAWSVATSPPRKTHAMGPDLW